MTFRQDFLKKVDLNLKMWTFYAWFSEKSGPRPENVDLLRMIFWKKWTSTWKCGPFTHDFLQKVDLDLKMWTFYTWFSEKSGPRPENVDLFLHMIFWKSGTPPGKCGPLCMIFWKKWTSTRKCGPFTHDFLKKVDLKVKNVDLLRMIFLKKWTSTWRMWTFTHDFLKKVDLDLKMWTFYAWFSEKGGPQPEKCGPFTHDFLKKVDLDLKMWALINMRKISVSWLFELKCHFLERFL